MNLRTDINQQQRPITITDLNQDCLMEIFNYFDIRELFNVSITNTSLRFVARSIYIRKFRTKCVVIDINEIHIGTVARYAHWITIHGLRTCLQFLRHFGSCIIKLQISYYQSDMAHSNRYTHVDQYINTYCCETIINISYFQHPGFTKETYQIPFIKVECIEISSVDLNISLPLFTEWFPYLRQLELTGVRIDRNFVEALFPNLKHLKIDLNRYNCTDFAIESIANLLSINQQLTTIIINMSIRTLTTLSNMIHQNSMISQIIMPIGSNCFDISAVELMKFANEHPFLVKFELPEFQFSTENVITCIRQLKSLQRFRFTLDDRNEIENLMTELDSEWESTIYQEWFENIRCIITLNKHI